MMRLLYPLVASALVTILPFLISFEKGQDIVRGLFGYSEFALLLLFVWLKSFICKKQKRSVAGVASICGLVLIFAAMVVVAWLDLLNLLSLKDGRVGWYGVLPFLTCAMAIAMVWKVQRFKLPTICLILFVVLIVHLGSLNYYAAQPLVQFPVVDYLARTSVSVEKDRKVLPKDYTTQIQNVLDRGPVFDDVVLAPKCKTSFSITDSVTITRRFLDSTRTNVIILVESWGVPLNSNAFARELLVFDCAMQQAGVHSRVLSRTRTAEREDLLFRFSRDSLGRRDSVFWPSVYATMGYRTTFLYGGDSAEERRYKYIENIGFAKSIWGTSEYRLPDFQMIGKIDSVLASAEKAETLNQKQFIAFTTRDTKFPLPGFGTPYSGSADSIESVYSSRLSATLKNIANLARKYPSVRFIVQGDHEPILSPRSFQGRFYKRWVPFVILN